eukprot:TRINITY_DN27903_c0_g1_i2.p1 TRINITY_DN27903_c0_g1~~TRINITY_DN27903_c0_g1_i2.p1  ORF type:complete len:928 (-),score=206.47 TRINITY_DN27903_c0_g1_i2:180-2963(-)
MPLLEGLLARKSLHGDDKSPDSPQDRPRRTRLASLTVDTSGSKSPDGGDESPKSPSGLMGTSDGEISPKSPRQREGAGKMKKVATAILAARRVRASPKAEEAEEKEKALAELKPLKTVPHKASAAVMKARIAAAQKAAADQKDEEEEQRAEAERKLQESRGEITSKLIKRMAFEQNYIGGEDTADFDFFVQERIEDESLKIPRKAENIVERDPFDEEVSSLKCKQRSMALCSRYMNSGSPMPCLYRGMRGIDFTYNRAQAQQAEADKKAQEEKDEDEAGADSKEESGIARVDRANNLLRQTTFFRDMEKQKHGIIKKLAKVAVFRVEKEGQVIFRQEDAPGSCYLLVEGSVGVYIKGKSKEDEPESPRVPPDESKPTLSQLKVAIEDHGRWQEKQIQAAKSPAGGKESPARNKQKGRNQSHSRKEGKHGSRQDSPKNAKDKEPEIPRPPTDDMGRFVFNSAEFSSTFTEESNLGQRVAVLESGALFGELALLNDAPRKATLKCMEDVYLLIIRNNSFRKVLKHFIDIGKTSSILKMAPLFANLEADTPGITAGLAASSQLISEMKNQVIFREGDRGLSAFIVASGQVGVFIRKKDKKHGITPRGSATEGSPTLTEWYRSGKDTKDRAQRAQDAKLGLPPKPAQSFRTIEGFSSFGEDSKFGDRVALLGPGAIFGELALQNNEPRSATILCTQDCELLMLRKADYLEAVNKRLEKVRFFDQHVPGVDKVVLSKAGGALAAHPSSFFNEEYLNKGFVLLMEGIFARKPVLYVIGEGGRVEFRRYKRPDLNPAYILAARPQSAPDGDALKASPMGKRKAAERALTRTQSDAALRSFAHRYPDPPDDDEEDGTELVDVLDSGGVFMSMNALPASAPEPFTVVVATPNCKIYSVSGPAIEKMPQKLTSPRTRGSSELKFRGNRSWRRPVTFK